MIRDLRFQDDQGRRRKSFRLRLFGTTVIVLMLLASVVYRERAVVEDFARIPPPADADIASLRQRLQGDRPVRRRQEGLAGDVRAAPGALAPGQQDRRPLGPVGRTGTPGARPGRDERSPGRRDPHPRARAGPSEGTWPALWRPSRRRCASRRRAGPTPSVPRRTWKPCASTSPTAGSASGAELEPEPEDPIEPDTPADPPGEGESP